LEKLGHKTKLELAQAATQVAYYDLQKVKGEKPPDNKNSTAKTERLEKVRVAKEELEKAKIVESAVAVGK
jgi:hypothetical protein